MNLRTPLSWRRAVLRPLSVDELELGAFCDAGFRGVPAADEVAGEPAGCGWFDSSHDLQQGLLVTEHASADAVAAELPLQAWLDLHLAGWQPPRCSVQ